MKIHIARGKGVGTTELGAFDAALNDSGIANFNLLRLSSVIPPNVELIEETGKIPTVKGEWGDRLYVVQAHYEASSHGAEAWAGVGWVVDEEGKGLFVEHEGESEDFVRTSIRHTLNDLMKNRGKDFGDIHMMVEGITCEDRPVCAMVTAVYDAEPWNV